MKKYKNLHCDKNGIPMTKELTGSILLIMNDEKAWTLNELINKVSQDIELPSNLKAVRSSSKTHYLIFDNHVKEALYELLKKKQIKRISRGVYRKNNYVEKIHSAFQNLSFNKWSEDVKNLSLEGIISANNVKKANAVPSVSKYISCPKSKVVNGFSKKIVGAFSKDIVADKNYILNNRRYSQGISSYISSINKFITSGNANIMAVTSKLSNMSMVPRKSAFDIADKDLKIAKKFSIRWNSNQVNRMIARSNTFNRILHPGKGIQSYVATIGNLYRNVATVNDRIATVGNVVKKVTDVDFNSLNLGFTSKSIDCLIGDGWCISTNEDIRFLLMNDDLSNKEILMKKREIYTEDKILTIIRYTIDKFIAKEDIFKEDSIYERHLKELKDILSILESDFSKYYLFYGDILSICEYALYQKLNEFFFENKDYVNFSSLKEMDKKIDYTLKKRNKLNLYAIKFVSVIKVMKSFWKPKKHNIFGRDTVQHGFLGLNSENKYNFAKTIQLLLSILNLNDPSSVFG